MFQEGCGCLGSSCRGCHSLGRDSGRNHLSSSCMAGHSLGRVVALVAPVERDTVTVEVLGGVTSVAPVGRDTALVEFLGGVALVAPIGDAR